MSDSTQNNDQYQKPDLHDCLSQLSEILKALGVEEFTIGHDYQHHTVNTEMDADKNLVDSFCAHIRQVHDNLMAAKWSNMPKGSPFRYAVKMSLYSRLWQDIIVTELNTGYARSDHKETC